MNKNLTLTKTYQFSFGEWLQPNGLIIFSLNNMKFSKIKGHPVAIEMFPLFSLTPGIGVITLNIHPHKFL